jgi:acyl-CoA oxidase
MSVTTENQRQSFLQSEAAGLTPLQRAVLPWLYVAWAEGSLGPEVLSQIAGRLSDEAFEAEGLEAVRLLLDASLTPQEFNQLHQLILQSAAVVSGVEWSTFHRLMDFSQALAGPDLSEAGRESLQLLELHLELAGAATPAELNPDRGRPLLRSDGPRRFNPRPLKKMLAGPRPEFREKMFNTLENPRFRHDYSLSTPVFRDRVYNWCLEFSRDGLGRLPYPVEVGGGGDLLGFLTAMEALAHFDLSLVIKFGVHFGLFCGSVFHLGTERHHQEILPRGFTLELPGCFAMTETGHGSNVRSLETTARYDGAREEFVVHTPNLAARKDYIGNAALHARMATVFAQLEIEGQHFGVHAFLVPIRDDNGAAMPGVHIEDCGEKAGLHGVDNGRLRFTHVRIPRLNLLDRFAQVSADGTYRSPITSPTKRFFTMISTLVLGRVTLAAAATSVSKNALSIALRYGEQRRQFGAEGAPEQAILDYQTHQRRLMPRLASTLALNFAYQDLSLRCVDSLESEEGRRRVESLAAGLKAWGTWHAFDTVQHCRESCGGQGYLAANRFGDMRNDLDVFLTFEGDNTVLMQLVAKSLLTDFRHQFSEMGFVGLLQYLSRRATEAVSAWNPLVTRSVDVAHLRDFEFHLRAFKARENHLLTRVAGRLKKMIESGSEPWVAFNQCQDHLVTLAKASVERNLLECFQAAVQRCADAPTQAVLSQFCCLFALARLEVDRAWFLENGYFEGIKSKAIRDQVLELCRQTRLMAWDVMAAFGIPDKLLAAPIALGDFPAPPVAHTSG